MVAGGDDMAAAPIWVAAEVTSAAWAAATLEEWEACTWEACTWEACTWEAWAACTWVACGWEACRAARFEVAWAAAPSAAETWGWEERAWEGWLAAVHFAE